MASAYRCLAESILIAIEERKFSFGPERMRPSVAAAVCKIFSISDSFATSGFSRQVLARSCSIAPAALGLIALTSISLVSCGSNPSNSVTSPPSTDVRNKTEPESAAPTAESEAEASEEVLGHGNESHADTVVLTEEEAELVNSLREKVSSAESGIASEASIYRANAELIGRTGTDDYLIKECRFKVKNSYKNEESFRITWGPSVTRNFNNASLQSKYDAAVFFGAYGTNSYGAGLTRDYSCWFRDKQLIYVHDKE